MVFLYARTQQSKQWIKTFLVDNKYGWCPCGCGTRDAEELAVINFSRVAALILKKKGIKNLVLSLYKSSIASLTRSSSL